LSAFVSFVIFVVKESLSEFVFIGLYPWLKIYPSPFAVDHFFQTKRKGPRRQAAKFHFPFAYLAWFAVKIPRLHPCEFVSIRGWKFSRICVHLHNSFVNFVLFVVKYSLSESVFIGLYPWLKISRFDRSEQR
jgi:hypothetical protein